MNYKISPAGAGGFSAFEYPGPSAAAPLRRLPKRAKTAFNFISFFNIHHYLSNDPLLTFYLLILLLDS
jgi:hypothetical protein